MNNNHPVVSIAKYVAIAIIWSGVLALGIIIAIASAGADGNSASVGLGIAAFITAAVSTGIILETEKGNKSAPKNTADLSKRKNDQGSIDPMSLLTDEDIAELRQDVKDNLRRRLREGDAEDMTSFEALLSDQEQRKRR